MPDWLVVDGSESRNTVCRDGEEIGRKRLIVRSAMRSREDDPFSVWRPGEFSGDGTVLEVLCEEAEVCAVGVDDPELTRSLEGDARAVGGPPGVRAIRAPLRSQDDGGGAVGAHGVEAPAPLCGVAFRDEEPRAVGRPGGREIARAIRDRSQSPRSEVKEVEARRRPGRSGGRKRGQRDRSFQRCRRLSRRVRRLVVPQVRPTCGPGAACGNRSGSEGERHHKGRDLGLSAVQSAENHFRPPFGRGCQDRL